MPDERTPIAPGIEGEIRGLVKDVSELKGAFGQMDKRLSSVETAVGDLRKDNRQLLFVVLGTWVTTMLAIITMSLTILSRLR